MSNFDFDKAMMAVKAQRYSEGQKAFESALDKEYSVEGWTGLGICKLFQLAEDQTMDEVIYCYNKAKEVEGADIKTIDLQLISYSTLVIEKLSDYCLLLIEEIINAERDKSRALVTTAVASAIAMSSESRNTRIISGVVAGVGAGVAIGKIADIRDSKSAGQFTLKLIQDIHGGVSNFLADNNKYDELQAFNQKVNSLKVEIEKRLNDSEAYKKLRKSDPLGTFERTVKNKNITYSEMLELQQKKGMKYAKIIVAVLVIGLILQWLGLLD